MGIGLIGCSVVSYRVLDAKLVHEDAAGKKCGVFIRGTNIRNLYRLR